MLLNFLKMLLLFSIFNYATSFSQLQHKLSFPYGDNPKAGKYVNLDDFRMYYEIYGEGDPLLLIHGNGASIKNMKFQIDYFSKYYKVIVADSRAHGKSGIGSGNLTYIKMADDYSRLLDSLKINSAYILGWSDGGIIGLLIAIYHPNKVVKLAVMGANLRPDSSAVYPWAVDMVKKKAEMVNKKISEKDTTSNWILRKKLLNLLGKQPHISHSDLHKITAPVLVCAGDKDVIREEHTVEIYQNIKNAHLAIFPGETHLTPVNNPELFNNTVFNFFKNHFTRPDTKDYFK